MHCKSRLLAYRTARYKCKSQTGRARQLGLESRVHFILADFLELPKLGLFRAAWAIESFVHADDLPASSHRRLQTLITEHGW